MTRDEAVQFAKNNILAYASEMAEFKKMAIEALEKQQTTKYKHLGTRHTHWGKCRHDKFRCETCGFTKEFTNNHTAQYQYCPSCGRKIDWSKPKGDSYDFAIIDEAVAQKGNKDD